MGSILTDEDIETIKELNSFSDFNWKYITDADKLTEGGPTGDANLGNAGLPGRRLWRQQLNFINDYFGEIEDILDATLPQDQRVNSGYETPRLVIGNRLRVFRNTIVAENQGNTGPEKKLIQMVEFLFNGEVVGKTEAVYLTDSTIFQGLHRGLIGGDKHYTIPLQFVFTAQRQGDDALGGRKAGAAFVVYANLLALHNALFGSSLLPLYGKVTRGTHQQVGQILENVKVGVNFLRELMPVASTEATFAGFSIGSLSARDKTRIVANPEYRDYFSTTFNAGAITAVPLLYNFYLTAEYFQEINKSFESSKDRALDVIWSIIKNDNNFDNTPDMRRGASEVAIAASSGQDQTSAFNSASRDFILKMLIKTPIDILKGLVELIDPHVAISKVIKTGSGFAFNELAGVLDEPAKELNTAITAAAPEIEPNVKGEDLVKLILCLAEFAMTTSVSMPGPDPQNPPPPPENFFPDISIDGIDFTGTVSGLLMIPPSPLGLLYLLLELIKSSDTNETINVSDVSNTKDC